MAKLLTPEKRIEQARSLVQEARDLPFSEDAGWSNFSYVANVKETLRKAFELIKLIPYSPSASADTKKEVKALIEEIKQAEQEILHKT